MPQERSAKIEFQQYPNNLNRQYPDDNLNDRIPDVPCTKLTVSQKCYSKDVGGESIVCVCDENYCDTISPVQPVSSQQYIVYTSSKSGERLEKTVHNVIGNRPRKKFTFPYSERICNEKVFQEYQVCGVNDFRNIVNSQIQQQSRIHLDPSIYFQKIIGFGGAFTDSTGIHIREMSPKLQEYLMRSYFSEDGLEYNLGRVPMGGTDFSTHYYSYIDSEEFEVNCVDPLLGNFHLAEEDFLYKIPLIQEATALTKNKLKLFTSTWSAPKSFKENNNYRGTLGFIKRELYQLWANYFVKFLDYYMDYGIEFWGLSTGNEPFFAMSQFSNIPGVLWMPDDLGEWVREYLGPTVQNSTHKNINILTIDDNRPILLHALPKIFTDQKNLNYVQGIAVHSYFDDPNNTHILDRTHALYPNKFILCTESCTGLEDKQTKLGSWGRAEIYAQNIIENLNHWVSGWVDWNMVLDTEGGPNLGSAVDASIISNVTEFYKQPQYYAIGHFAKFIPRGSVRVFSSQCDGDDLVDSIAFRRPDGGNVVVILNRREYAVQRTLVNYDRPDIDITLTAHSIKTILFW